MLSPRGAAVSAELAGRYPTVSVAGDNQAVVDGSDEVLVCLRKADAALLGDLTWRPDQVVVSAVAGVGIAQLTEWVAPARWVCRSVPMPPVADRAGLTAVHPPLAEARTLFDKLGTRSRWRTSSPTRRCPRRRRPWRASSSTSAPRPTGSIPGHPRDDARRYVAATYAGALTSLKAVAVPDFAELARDYATPGGVNEQVARDLREHGSFDVLEQALTGRSAAWPPELTDLVEDGPSARGGGHWWQIELVVGHPQEGDAHSGEAGGGDEEADALADVVRDERVRCASDNDGESHPGGHGPAPFQGAAEQTQPEDDADDEQQRGDPEQGLVVQMRRPGRPSR